MFTEVMLTKFDINFGDIGVKLSINVKYSKFFINLHAYRTSIFNFRLSWRILSFDKNITRSSINVESIV